MIEVPVRYGGEYGPDLESVAAYHNLQIEDVIRIHSEKIYTVYMMGFTPGFPIWANWMMRSSCHALKYRARHVPAELWQLRVHKPEFIQLTLPGGWHLIG